METRRIQLEFSKDMMGEFDNMMKETNSSTRKELFNNALSLLKWAIKEKKAGMAIASVNEKDGKYKEVVMPILDAVSTKSGVEK
jgi:metal-responsive CopG/Arc/MetJ family transcriptional regulator